MTEPISVDYHEAARITGVSIDVIRRAVRACELTPRYPTARPVIRVADLNDWIDRAPTERPDPQKTKAPKR